MLPCCCCIRIRAASACPLLGTLSIGVCTVVPCISAMCAYPSRVGKLLKVAGKGRRPGRIYGSERRVRDQEVEGSNPSAPTMYSNNFNNINILQSAERRFLRMSGSIFDLDLRVSHQRVGSGWPNVTFRLADRSHGKPIPCLFRICLPA